MAKTSQLFRRISASARRKKISQKKSRFAAFLYLAEQIVKNCFVLASAIVKGGSLSLSGFCYSSRKYHVVSLRYKPPMMFKCGNVTLHLCFVLSRRFHRRATLKRRTFQISEQSPRGRSSNTSASISRSAVGIINYCEESFSSRASLNVIFTQCLRIHHTTTSFFTLSKIFFFPLRTTTTFLP